MSPEIILYTDNNKDADLKHKWDMYSRYIFRGSDLLNKDRPHEAETASPPSGAVLSEEVPGRAFQSEEITGRAFQRDSIGAAIPDKIASMLAMYEFGDGSFHQKCMNFIRQGTFMADYEDDAPWYGDLKPYFPVYHDLNVRQLRGYFTWRASVRKGAFRRTCPAFAYIYIYELLNGIGVKDESESLIKLLDFRDSYVETGMGDVTMKGNIRRWLFEFAVTHVFPEETAIGFVEKSILERDHALSVLRCPCDHDDEEVFQAIRRFASSRTALSTVLSKDRARGVRLFAAIWRHIAGKTSRDGKDIFTLCFGEKETKPWRPLANAVYIDRRGAGDIDFHLDECRRYFRQSGEWMEESFNALSGDRNAFMALMHSADRRLRTIVKSGHYLHKKEGDEWAMPYIDEALREIQAEEAEAARPKITVDLSSLDKIREDAVVTRDSLLTDYEMDDNDAAGCDGAADPAAAEDNEASAPDTNDMAQEGTAPAGAAQNDTGFAVTAKDQTLIEGLDQIHMTVLTELLAGRSVEALIDENHLMPSVVADSINEALIDEIGDSVVECTDGRLAIVEDYIDDLADLTGGIGK